MRLNAALKISLLLTILSASATLTSAQEGYKPRSVGHSGTALSIHNNTKFESPLRARARDLAVVTADEALKWDDRQAAVHVLSQAADLLWEKYPERSCAWLERAWAMTCDIADDDPDGALRRFRSDSPQSRARAAILVVAQKHDRRLANLLLEQLTDEKEQSRYDSRRAVFNDRTARSEQLLNVALMIVESDPATSAKLAEQSLEDGVSFQLQGLLVALRERDEAAANRVFDSAVNRLATTFTHPSEGHVLASYLFTPGRVIGVGEGKTTALAVRTQSPVPSNTPANDDPVRARRFLSVMQRILLSTPAPATTANPSQTAQEFITLSGSLADAFKRHAPDLWTPIEYRIAQVIPNLTPTSPDRRLPSSVRERIRAASGADERELNRLFLEGLEEAAEKETNPTARKLAFVQVALATAPEDLDRGRKLAGKIDEAGLREQVISFLVYRAALLGLERNRLDEAVDLAAEARPLERAVIFVTAAQQMTKQSSNTDEEQALKLRLRALNLLSDAEKLLERNDIQDVGLNVRLGLVAALAPLDSVRALEVFGSVTATINKDTSFDAFRTGAPRVTRLAGVSDSLSPLIRKGYGLKDAVRSLARADFEDAVMITSKLSAPAVRGTSMMEIARSALSTESAK